MRLRFLLAWLLPALLVACSTTQTTLNYQPAQPAVAVTGAALFGVGSFEDQRGTDAHWLGAIRGGFGQPLKTIELQDTASAVVASAYRQALMARGLLAANAPRYLVSGKIIHLDCSQFVNREAHADIDLVVTDTKTGQVTFEQVFQKRVVQDAAFGDAGILASVDDLKAVAGQALNQEIDDSLNSDNFQREIAAARTASL